MTGIFFIYKNKLYNYANYDTPPVTAINSNPEITLSPILEEISEYNIPILMYHYIRNTNEPENTIGYKLSISPEKFDEQLKWLKNNGYKTINFDYLIKPYKLDFKPVIITFDDGYRDAYTEAFPILKKYNFTATFFIITNLIDYPYYMTWEMIKEMKNSKMKFGSHTLSHPDLRKLDEEKIHYELAESKIKLEKELGENIDTFCYPSGKYDERTIQKLKDLNYKFAVTTKTGFADKNTNPYELPRLRIQNNTNLESLLNKN